MFSHDSLGITDSFLALGMRGNVIGRILQDLGCKEVEYRYKV